MRAIFLLAVLLVSAGLARAQSAPPQTTASPVPNGPLLKPAPDFSRWVVVTTPYTGNAAAQPSPSPVGAKGRPALSAQRQEITKTGAIRHVTGTDEDGVNEDLWIQGTMQIFADPSKDQYMLVDARDGVDSYFARMIGTDFPGFQWISARNFVGASKVAGRDCLVFRDNVLTDVRRDETSVLEEVTACVDLETRLPVYLKKNNKESFFQFGQPPDASLVLPPGAANAIKERAQHIEQLTRAPARPY